VAEVTDWFKGYWDDAAAVDYTDELIAALRESPLLSDEYTPFEVLIKTLAARYGLGEPPELEGVQFTLQWFQEQAVHRLVRLLDGPAGAALLADAVGLGKTFMALGVVHHYVYEASLRRRGRGRPVLIVTPASLKPMWDDVLARHQLEWACQVLTTQSLRGEFDPAPYEGAELVVVDEAHRLRGRGQWYQSMMRLLHRGEAAGQRRVLLLTATPVNTDMDDLVALLDVATRERRQVWAPAIADYRQYLRRVEREGANPFPVLDRFVVRRSRSDVLRAQESARASGKGYSQELTLPQRQLAHATYDYGPEQAGVFDDFASTLRRLSLAPYDLERYRLDDLGEKTAAEARAEYDKTSAIHGPHRGAPSGSPADVPTRPGTIAALYAAGLLTRFQSSLRAIDRSLTRLRAVLSRCLQGAYHTTPRLPDLSSSDIRKLLREEVGVDLDSDEEVAALEERWERAFEKAPKVDPDGYDLDAVATALQADMERVERLMSLLPDEADDGKVDAMATALRRDPSHGDEGRPGLAGMPLLVFSQFRDTVEYLHERLADVNFDVRLLHGGITDEARARVADPFDPGKAHVDDVRGTVLVSTDVLAEGYNLQNAQAVVNFDLHFNPQVAAQRSGRVDRMHSPHSTVYLVSFTPPESLNAHISLLGRLDERFRRIHGLGLGDEPVTDFSGDVQHRTLEQMKQLYTADDPTVLEEAEESGLLSSTDGTRLVLDMFLRRAGRERIERIPHGVSSVRRRPPDAELPAGAFLSFTEPGGEQAHWRYYPRRDAGWGEPVADEMRMFHAINCTEEEPRADLPDCPAGPTCVDWDLVARAAHDLADELNKARAAAARRAGSETSKLRTLVQRKTTATDVDATALLDRLEEVELVRWKHEPDWQEVEARLTRVDDIPDPEEREQALADVVAQALEVLGPPQEEPEHSRAPRLDPEELRLVSYERIAGPS
jgi:superfamily II DNA or RNA helicase